MSTRMFKRILFIGCVVSMLPPALLANEEDQCAQAMIEREFSQRTGDDLRNYPPDPQVDFQHLKLEIDMSDPLSKTFTCNETLTFKTLQRPIRELSLDCVDLQIGSVTDLEDRALSFSQSTDKLTIHYPQALELAKDSGVKISYTCREPKSGMVFALPDEGYPNRPVSIHTQGQTETNRYWFISHDYPNERMTSEVIVTIPSKYKALSNGALMGRDEIEGGKVKYHHSLSKPHVSYLVSLVIGEFDVVTDKWREIPVEYWVPPSEKDNVKRTFGKTPEMIELFSKLTGADYPYEKYAQSVVYNFAAGGMENTSTTTLMENTPLDERAAIDHDQEGLISHELAHQWFGDMITCRSWTHIWLNEGFATYFSHLWEEHARGREEYDAGTWGTMRGVVENDSLDARAGVVFPFYSGSWENFGKSVSNPYSKGASVLHMLRQSLGDELFFRVISTYVKRNAWTSVETDDLRKVCDELSGKSYERFFQQWLYRAGSPKMQVKYEWNEEKKLATVNVEQKQKISAESPAFTGEVPVWLVRKNGSIVKDMIKIEARSASVDIACGEEPLAIAYDPNGAMLAGLELDLPEAMLSTLAKSGPTTMSRLSAIAALTDKDRPESRETLAVVLKDEKSYYAIREQAAQSLGKMMKPEARDLLLAALKDGISDHKVRRSTIEAVARYRSKEVAAVLLGFAKSDPSYAVERVATEGLGNQDATDEITAQLLANCEKPSQRDQIRTAAVKTLARLGELKALDAAIKLASAGQPVRSRSAGIEALAELGKDDSIKPRVRQMLIGFLEDPSSRVTNSAISALGELGDPKAIDSLQLIAKSGRPEDVRDRAKDAIEKINQKRGESDALRDLRERVKKLEEAGEKKS